MNRNLFLVAASLFPWGWVKGSYLFPTLYLQEWGADPVMIVPFWAAWELPWRGTDPQGLLSDKFSPKTLMLGPGSSADLCLGDTLARSLPVFVIGLLCTTCLALALSL